MSRKSDTAISLQKKCSLFLLLSLKAGFGIILFQFGRNIHWKRTFLELPLNFAVLDG